MVIAPEAICADCKSGFATRKLTALETIIYADKPLCEACATKALKLSAEYYQREKERGASKPETLTLRDQFAMAALPAIIESLSNARGVPASAVPKEAAYFAYEFADAMMERRSE